MYDVRFSMYDLKIRARCAGERLRLAAPMYDLRLPNSRALRGEAVR